MMKVWNDMMRLLVAGVCVLIVVLVVTALFFPKVEDSLQSSAINADRTGQAKPKMADPQFWKTVNLQEEDIPAAILGSKDKIEVAKHHINVMGIDTFYRKAEPPQGSDSGITVLLLHGAAFKSETWLNLGTIHLLSAMGHRVFAVDLPGYGETGSKLRGDHGEYLSSLMSELSIETPVLVSPSMSGGFSFRYLLKHPHGLLGFVPVAPVQSELMTESSSSMQVPTLIIYGEKDKGLGIRSRDDLLHIPASQAVKLPDAGHPAYLDQPDMFHKLLYNFLKQLKAHPT